MAKAANVRKRRAQRGRPRKEGVGRTPSGAVSRAQENVMGVVIEARIRHGVSEAEAPRQEGGTALGRLWGQKLITTAQKDAGDAYAELHAEAEVYAHAPKGFQRIDGGPAMDWDCKDFDPEAYTQRAIDKIGKRDGLCAALTEAKAEASVFWVAILDCDPPDWMLPALRDGLTLLARNFRTEA
jgi:hypothetical protein